MTVEEQQRTVLLSVASVGGVCLCPLCGQPVNVLPPEGAGVVTLDHSQMHTRRPEPEMALGQGEQVELEQLELEQKRQGSTPRLGTGGDTRRLG